MRKQKAMSAKTKEDGRLEAEDDRRDDGTDSGLSITYSQPAGATTEATTRTMNQEG